MSRCTDCGAQGELPGHMECQYPGQALATAEACCDFCGAETCGERCCASCADEGALDDLSDICSNPEGHVWNRIAGEADEARLSGDHENDNVRCIHCGADGDA